MMHGDRTGRSAKRWQKRLRALRNLASLWRKVLRRVRGVSARDQWMLIWSMLVQFSKLVINRPTSWYPETVRDCRVDAAGVGRFHVRARSDDLFHALPNQEPAVERAIRRLLQPGAVFVDAGSNIGYYAVLAARLVGASGRVIAVEMMPETAAVLREQVALNGCSNVTVVEGALAADAGMTLTASYRPRRSGTASLVRAAGQRTVTVQTVTLAELLRGVERVDCLKLDLEGAELGALQGLGPHLARVGAIVFENQHDEAVPALLQAQQFTLQRLDRTNYLAVRSLSA